MTYKLLEIDTKGVVGTKIDIKAIQEGVNEYANEGWEIHSITPIASNQGKTEKLLITLQKS